jgi:hypothetical protein
MHKRQSHIWNTKFKYGFYILPILLILPMTRVQASDTQAVDALGSQIMDTISTFAEKVNIEIDANTLFYSTLQNGLVATALSKGVDKIDSQIPLVGTIDIGVVMLTVPITTEDNQQVPPGIYKAQWSGALETSINKAKLIDEYGQTIASINAAPPHLGECSLQQQPSALEFQLKPVQLEYGQFHGSSFTRCYGFLLFCCESRDPYACGETICHWCGFCFGVW